MGPSGHSILSPSSAKRWLTCTPSAKLEAGFSDSSSDAAIEGTLAHAIAECMLRQKRKPVADHIYQAELNRLKYLEFTDHGQTYLSKQYFSDAMLSYCEDYVAVVLSAMRPGALLFIEERVSITEYVPEPDAGGTMDAGVWFKKVFKFFDLKFGKGVAVDANDNYQLKLYALGVLQTFGYLGEIEVFELNIYQPRNDIGHTTFVITVPELLAWAREVVIPMSKLAYAGTGSLQPSVEACRFCKAKATCKALADFSLEPESYNYKSPYLISDEELIELKERRELMSIWMGSIDDYMFSRAMQGYTWPGLKLIHKSTNRVISDPVKAAHLLRLEGFEDDQFLKPRPLKALGDLEKLAGKKEFNLILGPVIIKPKGEPILVHESAKGEPYIAGFQVFVDNPIKKDDDFMN